MASSSEAKCHDIPCSCIVCKSQYVDKPSQESPFFRYHGHCSLEQVKGMSAYFIDSITTNQNYLRLCIVQSGNSLLKRWRQSEKGRKQFLLKADPHLYPTRDALIDISKILPIHGSSHQSVSDTESKQKHHRMTFLLPYLNLEDLSKESCRFIRLLHYRAEPPLQHWVTFDNEEVQRAWAQRRLSENFADGGIVLEGSTFGRALNIQASQLHSGWVYGSPRGLLILEAQYRLFRFLRRVTESIMTESPLPNAKDDIDSGLDIQSTNAPSMVAQTADMLPTMMDLAPSPSAPLQASAKWSAFIERPLQGNVTRRLAGYFEHEPFSAPPRFHASSTVSTIVDLTLEAMDELFLLQTDPGMSDARLWLTLLIINIDYFVEQLRIQQATPINANLATDKLAKLKAEKDVTQIAFSLTIETFTHARDFLWVIEDLKAVKAARARSDTAFTVEEQQRALQDYFCNLNGVLRHLHRIKAELQYTLARLIVTTSTFYPSLKMEFPKDDIPILISSPAHAAYDRDPLAWCLTAMTVNKPPHSYATSTILQKIDIILQDTQQFKRIDGATWHCLSRLADIEKIMHICNLHRPVLNPFRHRRDAPVWRYLHFALCPTDPDQHKDIGISHDDIAVLRRESSPKRPLNREWLADGDQRRAHLIALWKKAKHGYLRFLERKGVPHDLHAVLGLDLLNVSSQKHSRAMARQRDQALQTLAAEEQQRHVEEHIPLDMLIFDDIDKQSGPPPPISPKKTKTRPGPSINKSPEVMDLEEADEMQGSPPVLYRFKERSKTWRVIIGMFPAAEDSDVPTPVQWKDLTRAMVDFGFAVMPGKGSQCKFTGDVFLNNDAQRRQKATITLHKPHPDPSVSTILLQAFGTRCQNHFGWTREHFATT